MSKKKRLRAVTYKFRETRIQQICDRARRDHQTKTMVVDLALEKYLGPDEKVEEVGR